jgi:hypothetical protein
MTDLKNDQSFSLKACWAKEIVSLSKLFIKLKLPPKKKKKNLYWEHF